MEVSKYINNIKKEVQKSCGLSVTPTTNENPVPCNGKLYSTKCIIEEENIGEKQGTQHEINQYLYDLIKERTDFEGVFNHVLVVEDGLLKSMGLEVNIPYGIETIADNAFEGEGIKKVTIPDSVTAIGDNAFINNKITQVTLPSDCTYYATTFDSEVVVTGGILNN